MTLRLHAQFIRMKVAERMAYRFDFFTSFLAYFLWQFVALVFVSVMINAGGQFPGWTFPQVIVLQGIMQMVKGFSFMLFFGIVWNSNRRIRDGTFDHILMRPVNALWLLVMDSFDSEDIGQFVGGLTLMSIGIIMVGGIQGSLLLFGATLLLGILFFFSLALLISAITIRVIQTGRMYEFVTVVTILGGYPKTLYGRTMGAAFTVAFPLFIAAHYPASALLGLDTAAVGWATLATLTLFFISITIWHKALKAYSSAGG